MTGTIESAVRSRVHPGDSFRTVSGEARFTVAELRTDGIVLLLGKNENRTLLRWPCLEGLWDFLDGRGWVRAGGKFSVEGEVGTLDAYLKQCTKRDTARWVAVLLEHAGIVELDRTRPVKVRLRRSLG